MTAIIPKKNNMNPNNLKNESESQKELSNNTVSKSRPILHKTWLDKSSESYKFWVREIKKGESYMTCILCSQNPPTDNDYILVQSCYRKHSHQNDKTNTPPIHC